MQAKGAGRWLSAKRKANPTERVPARAVKNEIKHRSTPS